VSYSFFNYKCLKICKVLLKLAVYNFLILDNVSFLRICVPFLSAERAEPT